MDVLKKFGHLDFPRFVAAREFPDGRLRRAHLRQHFVIRQPLHAVAAAESFPVQLGVAAVDFEAEQIFPFAATDVQPGGLAGGVAQAQKRIVVHRHLPEIRRGMAFHGGEFAEKNPRQINQVHALVNQFAAAGKLRVRAPFLLVAHAPALAVTPAHEHHRPQRAAAKNLQRLQAGRMIAVIVAHAHAARRFFRGGRLEFFQFRHADRRRVFPPARVCRASPPPARLARAWN